MNCPYCNSFLPLIQNRHYYCLYKDQNHEFSCGNEDNSLWYLFLRDKKIQVGRYPGGHYITYFKSNNSEVAGNLIHIKEFAINNAMNIIEKYLNLRSFL